MKTERRHNLESNTLAKGLNEWGDRLRPYSSGILAAVALLLGVYIAASLWNAYQARRDRAAWDDFQLALFEGDSELRGLYRLTQSEDHAGTEMQEWAMVGWADRQLLTASREYLTNRDEAKERLTNIEGTYESLADNGSSPEIRNRARLGLARVCEMQNKLDEAREHYELVEGPLAAIAADRIKQLESKEAQETTKWLATVDLPKPKPAPGPGVPGQRPGFGVTPPAADAEAPMSFDTPQSLEEILGGAAASGESGRYGEAATPAESAPAGDEPSAPGTPAGEPEATEPPAAQPPSEDQPAAEQPAADQPAPAAPEQPAEAPAEEPDQTSAAPGENAAAPAQK